MIFKIISLRLFFEFTHLMEDAEIFISVLPLALWLLAGTNVL